MGIGLTISTRGSDDNGGGYHCSGGCRFRHSLGALAMRMKIATTTLVAIVLGGIAAQAKMTTQLAQEWGDIPDNLRSWFKSVRSPHGVPCCDVADGHRTAYDIRSDGYWVPIEGEWRQVPPDAVVYNAGNPVGEAVVWYVRQGENVYHIRCFVPGGGV